MVAFSPFAFPDVLKSSPPKARSRQISVELVSSETFKTWQKKQSNKLRVFLDSQGWIAAPNSVALSYTSEGRLEAVYVGINPSLSSLAPLAAASETLLKTLSPNEIEQSAFVLAPNLPIKTDPERLCLGWAMGCYLFDAYKPSKRKLPQLYLGKAASLPRLRALVQAVCLTRNLINLPANALGPEDLARVAGRLAESRKLSLKILRDQKQLEKHFPLIHAVGQGSARKPCLIDLSWGNTKHPKITIVGKGVCFDSGGYDLKPSSAMLTMKKDMGGAAVALGLMLLVSDLNLPIRLRVLIPAVENSVSGHAYRPMDILSSRKGLSVEIGNTDAEGRLIMADCLTLACEEKPDLLIDFATLTGAARAATGMDIAAMFSNNQTLASRLQSLSLEKEDPVWQLPLWDGYKNDLQSPNADLTNSGNNPAGAITAALFLQSFLEPGTNWVHLDLSAWESAGKPGRQRGGVDMGLRAMLALLESVYAKRPGN